LKNLFHVLLVTSILSILIYNPAFAVPIEGDLESYDGFGWSIAVGDFNGDNIDDIAIGSPGESTSVCVTVLCVSADSVGQINVIYGSQASGLTGAGNAAWHQGASGIVDFFEPEDSFSQSLAAGDFNNDGADDLAVGVYLEDLQTNAGAMTDAGAVNVIYGAVGSGLTAFNNQIWFQGISGIVDAGEAEGDEMGVSLTSGDFDGDGADDLAIGDWREDIEGKSDAGAVNVIYGLSGCCLYPGGNQIWHQDSLTIEDNPESKDNFGVSLADGDFDNDGFDDLAIGVTGEDLFIPGIGNITNAGAVNVIYGSLGSGLTDASNQFWHQGLPMQGIIGTAAKGDSFGRALTTGDFNNDGADDLAVGINTEDVFVPDVGNITDAGAVNVIYGSSGSGLTESGNQYWHQDSPGIVGEPNEGDHFGHSVAAGLFGFSDSDTLIIGVPAENELEGSGTLDDPGAVNVIYGSSFGGLNDDFNFMLHQNFPGMLDPAEKDDWWGNTVNTGDFDNDGFDDLAVSGWAEDVSGHSAAGAVDIINGGFNASDPNQPFVTSQFWHQGSDQ
jgi:FG-GAP repeat protein